MALLLTICILLARENRLRDAGPRDTTYDDVYVEVTLALPTLQPISPFHIDTSVSRHQSHTPGPRSAELRRRHSERMLSYA